MTEKQKKRNSLSIMIIFVGIVSLALGVLYSQNQTIKKSERVAAQMVSGTVLKNPRVIPDFNLTDNQGRPFANENLQGHWTFLFFGFTNCPQVCPTTMAELSKMMDKLHGDKVKKMPEVVLISIDPQRDSSKKLNDYLKGFNNQFVGLTGDMSQIKELTTALGVVYMKTSNTSASANAMDYSIDHSGTVMLLNPNGRLTAFFSMPHDAGKLAQDYEKIVG